MLSRGGTWGVQHFPRKFPHRMALILVHVHFHCTRLHKMLATGYVYGIFPVNFRTEWLLYVSMCISIAHLAQNARHGICVQQFPCKFPHRMALILVHVHFHCARLHKMLATGYVYGIFPVNFRAEWLLYVSMCISIALARAKWPRDTHPAFSLSFFAQNGFCEMFMCNSITHPGLKCWPRD